MPTEQAAATDHSEPTVVEWGEQPYAAIRGQLTMETFGLIADRMPELFAWVAAHGTEPVGGPFFRYNVLGADGQLELEASVPVSAAPEPEGDVLVGLLPAGRYVTVTHIGHPDQLIEATERLLTWAAERGLEWDLVRTADGDERWACRLAIFKTDPRVEPDPTKWESEVTLRLADGS
ncbi:GyrI-like domain-containing protein [Streptomyces sp. H27-C3]|uniref:GyrI-like domain-containing protein n=1 Tax=Streptomyces sp. H27-C3 TaxID=3046305 RepID=UPI0024B8EAD7|nr:GyrI-like domain-containing protein [Streptomyces sp. H27-C3]MDJ0465164.1 GyrI-like domain-containing protein [Streptomyces sp. H27-C3]